MEASLKTIGKGAAGSLAGAGITAMHGAAVARSGEAIAIGAAIGAVVGLGIGADDDAVIRERLFIGSDGPRTVLPSGRR